MEKIISMNLILLCLSMNLTAQDAKSIIKKVDDNMSARNRIFESTMIIRGKRSNRMISSRSYSEGDTKSFTEYLSPAREQGTKMLKLGDELWIYSPDTDRTIRISGHMLRQSVMGSDLSYEDMMEQRKLTDIYDATVKDESIINGRKSYELELIAKIPDVAYYKRRLWVDAERFVPLKEELYAKSGQLLKRTTLTDIKQIQGRWFPTVIVYKDILKEGEGTEFRITSIKFNQTIPEYVFTKAALKK
jgi:outer membrane lipoprotein-sorting protein